jgi:Zn-dependent peptidase ImmA (M78 family)/DNA-binding XRE family transcriptional regulator
VLDLTGQRRPLVIGARLRKSRNRCCGLLRVGYNLFRLVDKTRLHAVWASSDAPISAGSFFAPGFQASAMSQGNFSIDVNPAVLEWARQAAGQTTTYVAERLGIAEQTVSQWEQGKKVPAWGTLRKLAHCYKRPLAALLLPEPPTDPDVPPDFRTLPTSRKGLSERTLLTIRRARWLQSRAIEMRQELNPGEVFATRRVQTTQRPEAIAADYRQTLGIDQAEQSEWQSSNEAYRRWRESLEEQGILVFQFSFPVDEVRGFSLFDPICPVIVVNESDAINARIFTLFHEAAHLLLQRPGICLPQETATTGDSNVEPFCNRFAAALLVPDIPDSWNISERITASALQKLANRYRVSREVVLVRLKTIGRISERSYQQMKDRWLAQAPARRRKPGGRGWTAAEICQRQRGAAFVSLVIDAAQRGAITDHDAVTYLGVKLNDLNKLRSKR